MNVKGILAEAAAALKFNRHRSLLDHGPASPGASPAS